MVAIFRLRCCWRYLGVAVLFSVISTATLAWNALGHRLIAQIAYDHLTTSNKKKVNAYNRLLNGSARRVSFVNAGPWLDFFHARTILGLPSQAIHYVDTPFSWDGTTLPAVKTPNALTAIQHASLILHNQSASDYDKALALRILLHVIADLHQPLHAAEQFSRLYPRGDRGANLFLLARNPIGKNLHTYWDRGGGFLLTPGHLKNLALQIMAKNIEKKWPCYLETVSDPKIWSQESFELAIAKAYQAHHIARAQKPSLDYQMMVQTLTEQRIARAGCRIADLLNQRW